MVRVLFVAATLFATTASAVPVDAACYADYKAKRESPLRLHYGVIELPDAACRNRSRARQAIERRLARANWMLLDVVSTFGENGLAERKASAGNFYLRF